MLKLADTSSILINPSPSNVKYLKLDLNNEHIHFSKRLLHQMTSINNKVKGMQSMQNLHDLRVVIIL